jgi:hypothetical protein
MLNWEAIGRRCIADETVPAPDRTVENDQNVTSDLCAGPVLL